MVPAQLCLSRFCRHHDFVQELLLLWQQKHSQGYLHLVLSNEYDESKVLEENSMLWMMVTCSGLPFFPMTPLHHLKCKVRWAQFQRRFYSFYSHDSEYSLRQTSRE